MDIRYTHVSGLATCRPCYSFHRSNIRTQTTLHQTTAPALPMITLSLDNELDNA